jgi:restriction endonuclease S subunit
MRYPSEYLHEIAEKLDPIEDDLIERYSERYSAARRWLSGWKVWEYRDQQEKLEALKERHEGLREDYYELARLYTEKTGEQPPLSVWAGLSSFESALERLVWRMRENLRR